MAHLTNFSFEFFMNFSQKMLLYFFYNNHGAKKSKMTKYSNQRTPALSKLSPSLSLSLSLIGFNNSALAGNGSPTFSNQGNNVFNGSVHHQMPNSKVRNTPGNSSWTSVVSYFHKRPTSVHSHLVFYLCR